MNEPYVAFGVLLAIAVVVWIIRAVNSQTADKEIKERQRRNRDEAQHFFMDMEVRKQLPFTQVDVVLKEGELGVFQEPSVLLETRAYRIYGGAGTRVGRIHVGGGASESHDRLREIDSGTLVLTNHRLIFDGGHENRSVKLPDVISANAWSDAIEISSSRRQKSQIYRVHNPIIWAQMIQMLASGDVGVTASHELPESTSPPASLMSAVQTGSSMQSEAGNLVGALGKSVARWIGNRVGRQIARGVLGSIFGSPARRTRR
jgi:hypothetical protein